MYWAIWDTTAQGEPLLENVPDEWVDDRIATAPNNEIVFEADLVTG